MTFQHHKTLIIGAGSAGYAAARTARNFHPDVAIVDNAEELGGLCILRGCMPSKTLIYIAEILHHARHADRFGLKVDGARADMQAVHQRKVAMIDDFKSYRQSSLEDTEKFTLYRQSARFLDNKTVELSDGTRLTADFILISTGSRIASPPIPGLNTVPVLTSDDILDLDHLPESMIVLGGGIVAAELAQFLNRMGTRVTLIQRSKHILRHAGEQAATVVEQALRDEGIVVYTGTEITAISGDTSEIRIAFEQGGSLVEVRGAHLFNALGRTPNTEGLDLEKAGIRTRRSGHIETGHFLQTSQSHIYAAGDVAGPFAVVHTAIRQGETAAQHFFGANPTPIDNSCPFDVIFTDPQIGRIGPSEEDLKQAGVDFESAEYPFNDHGKSLLMHALYGYVKIVAEKKTGRLLAAECVGKDAGELIHILSIPVQKGMTLRDLKGLYWYHPTLAEIWEYPIDDLYESIYG